MEAGVPGYETGIWFAMVVPKATPAAIVARLNTEVSKILKQEDMKAKFDGLGLELMASSPDLAQEMLQMVSEMRMTNDRRAAYDKLNVRVPLPEIGIFTQTLDQSDTYGTPFSRAMRTLIAEQRANRLIWIEEKAARLPVIMTIPLIFCIMPAVFVVLIGPAALSVVDNIISGG